MSGATCVADPDEVVGDRSEPDPKKSGRSGVGKRIATDASFWE